MRISVFLLATISFFIFFSGGALFFLANQPWIDFSPLEHYNPGKPSILLDCRGNEWSRFELDKRQPINLNQLPQDLINAFLAAEDHHFFSHKGISWRGIMRSLLVNLYHRKIVQGASTITQQLVKLLFFNQQRTFKRKIKEQLLSLLVERQFTKQQIIETYLNHVYFGCGIYGVEAASQRFWGKPASELTLTESATLAGIVRSPGSYCPLLHPERALQRRNVVLRSMANCGFITQEAYLQERTRPLPVPAPMAPSCAPHLREKLRMHLEEFVGKDLLYTGGLTIQTTLDTTIQQQTSIALSNQLKKLRTTINPKLDGAVVSIDVKSGAIRALVGGADFKESQFNRATGAYRQLGSLFKPIIYGIALEHGHLFSDVEIDEPLQNTMPDQSWQPQNHHHHFEGAITLARALSYSNNIVAIKLLLKLGIEKAIKKARLAGIEKPITPYPSLALGCIEASPLQAAALFSIFANHGMYTKPYAIEWIKNEYGSKIWRHTPEEQRVFAPIIADQVARVLCSSMERIKGLEKTLKGCQTMGKTGTTNSARSCWFAGSTPELTTVIYVGRDDNQDLGNNVYASQTAFPIWLENMRSVTPLEKRFNFDPSLVETKINLFSGEKAREKDPESITLLTPWHHQKGSLY